MRAFELWKERKDSDAVNEIGKLVPNQISDKHLLDFFDVCELDSISSKDIEKHKENNEEIWEKYIQNHENLILGNDIFDNNGKYIEKQGLMQDIAYGDYNASFNACEVIALYNALQCMNKDDVNVEFVDLLSEFESSGILLDGYFGTNPKAIKKYLDERDYQSNMLLDNDINDVLLREMQGTYSTYILTTYNNKESVAYEIHTMCITKESNGKFYLHNAYDFAGEYDSLEDAVSLYENGESEPISIIGVK